MNPKLHEAVAVFKALGFETAAPEEILSLPLGTAEQKKTAFEGLKSGEFGEFAQLSHNSYGWRSFVDVDEGRLAMFAVRVGIPARRAINLLRGNDTQLLPALISSRGEKYAADFIDVACVSRRRAWEHCATAFGNTAVRLVDMPNMQIPNNVEYIKDWAVFAAAALGLKAEIHRNEKDLPGIDLISRRFEEHITTGVAAGAPATGPFGAVLPEGVKRGFLSREKAIDLIFTALDAAVRPADRKVWLAALSELDVPDEEFCARMQALIPLLSQGDAAVVARLAPVFIAHAASDLLAEVVMASLSVSVQKTRSLVLKAALARPCPENAEGLEGLAVWLSSFTRDKDKTISSLASKLIEKWGIGTEAMPEEKSEIQGLWQETPEVWRVPDFELGEVSPQALTELAAQLVNRAALTHDVLTERFLAVLNAVAYSDSEAARTSLRGLRTDMHPLFSFVICWVKGEEPKFKQNFLTGARDYILSVNFGKLPCLLSTPSAVDLSVSVPDLAKRLAMYQETGAEVQEADLFMALARLDTKTKTAEAVAALSKIEIPVYLQSKKKMPETAGKIVCAYLEDPVKEPELKINEHAFFNRKSIAMPDSLRDFPDRLMRTYEEDLFSVFPLWGDSALLSVRWNSEVYHEQGLIFRQVARRAAPLPPGAAVNLLAAQRSATPDAAEDAARAVTEAWERGLLRPGTADIRFMDWSADFPSNLAALAAAMGTVAEDGLLSVVWPILDELVASSLRATRLLAGTAEIAELIETLLPEVQAAIQKGIANQSSLELPGIRRLAQRGGSTRAVSAAKRVAALLPPAQMPEAETVVSQAMDPPFEQVWIVNEKSLPLIDDGASMTVDWAEPGKVFLFTLTLPDIQDRVFQIACVWTYALENEGQCQAYAVAPGTSGLAKSEENEVWLHWDEKRKRMVVCDKRNWAEDSRNSFFPKRKGSAKTPLLSSSLLTVTIGMLAQGSAGEYYSPRVLRIRIKDGQMNVEAVRAAMRTLLKSPVVSPAKLVRALEKDKKLLPVLWPMLTESVKFAGAEAAMGKTPPGWVNRILDIALRYAPYLACAANRGLIPAEDAKWTGLSEIASSKAKAAAAKARELQDKMNI